MKDHLHLDLKADINLGNGLASDPIWGSLGPDDAEDPQYPTEESILESDLKKRKPAKFTLDPEEHPETQDSIAWAEKELGSKLVAPKKTPFELEMDKLDEDHKFNYDYEEDSDVTTTLKNAKLAEQ